MRGRQDRALCASAPGSGDRTPARLGLWCLWLLTRSACLAVPEKLGRLRLPAATDAARAACERPQEMAHLPGMAVFLDGRLGRQHAGEAQGSVRPLMTMSMVSGRMSVRRRIPDTDSKGILHGCAGSRPAQKPGKNAWLLLMGIRV